MLLALAAPGCGGGVQVSAENRQLVMSLATAASSREMRWIDQAAAQVEERRAQGKCPDAEYEALKGIVAKAKAGEWDAARDAAYALRDAQEPTAEDLQHLAERKVPHEAKTLKSARKAPR